METLIYDKVNHETLSHDNVAGMTSNLRQWPTIIAEGHKSNNARDRRMTSRNKPYEGIEFHFIA